MTTIAPPGCARCGTILDPNFRFCPECGLPASGDGVLSTQIDALRHRIESQTKTGPEPAWRRYLLPSLAVAMLAFVLGMGVVLFDRPLLDRLFPPPDSSEGPVVLRPTASLEPEWIQIPAGEFPFGDPADNSTGWVRYPYSISKYEVTNALWAAYLDQEEAHLRQRGHGHLEEAFPGTNRGWTERPEMRPWFEASKAKLPVGNVSPVAVADFCRWATSRFAEPGTEIRIPTRLEWEYAARGKEGFEYPWGNNFYFPAPGTGAEGELHKGIAKGPYPVDDAELRHDDTSPFGVIAMGTNVSEWTIQLQMLTDAKSATGREFEDFPPDFSKEPLESSFTTPGVHIAWSGASFADDAKGASRVAKAWQKVTYEPSGRLPQIGVRLVKVRVAK